MDLTFTTVNSSNYQSGTCMYMPVIENQGLSLKTEKSERNHNKTAGYPSACSKHDIPLKWFNPWLAITSPVTNASGSISRNWNCNDTHNIQDAGKLTEVPMCTRLLEWGIMIHTHIHTAPPINIIEISVIVISNKDRTPLPKYTLMLLHRQ